MLLQNIKHTGRNTYEADLLEVAGMSSACAIKDFILLANDETKGKVTLTWACEQNIPKADEKFFILGAEDNFFGDTDFKVDARAVIVAAPDEQPCKDKPIKILEMFAGGIAGWKMATQMLKNQCQIPMQTIAIEVDVLCAQGFAIGHDATMVDGFTTIPGTFFTHDGNEATDFIIHGDITSRTWLPAVAAWHPDIACVSSPCPPWSSAANALGLECHQGQLLAETIGILKTLRPRIILLEQVGGFAGHQDKSKIMRQLRWAGYILRWGKTVDLQQVCPARRIRWLGIATRANDKSIVHPQFQMWPKCDQQTPRSFQAILTALDGQESRLKLSPEAKAMAQDPQLLPPAKRKLHEHTALEFRCCSADQVPPCFMAMYGQQHSLSMRLLESKGLFLHLFQDASCNAPEPRLWHPVEILMLHAAQGSLWLPSDWTHSFMIVGNHVAVAHALLMIINALHCMPEQCNPPDMKTAMDIMYENRWTADKIFQIRLPQGDLITMSSDTQLDATHIQAFQGLMWRNQMPPGTCWHVNTGFVDFQQFLSQANQAQAADENPVPNAQADPEVTTITPRSCATTEIELSPTQAYTPLLRGQIVIGQKSSTFWFGADVPMDDLLAVWEDHFTIDTQRNPDANFALRLVPVTEEKVREFAPPVGDPLTKLIVLFCDQQLTIYRDDECARQAVTMDGQRNLFDQFGNMTNISQSPYAVHTMHEHFESEAHALPLPQFALAAAVESKTNTRINIKGELVISVTGPNPARATMTQMWQAMLSREALTELSLEACVKIQEECNEITYQHKDSHCAYPIPALRVLLTVKAFRFLFQPMRIEENHSNAFKVCIKWLSRPLWEGFLPGDSKLQAIMTCQAVACTFYSEDTRASLRAFRVVCLGRQYMPEADVNTCVISPQHGHAVLHLIPAMHGGGPTAKQSQVIHVKNSIAGSLLQEGYELQWVSDAIDALVKKAGLKPILPITNMPHGVQRMQAILNLLREVGVEMPKQDPKNSAAPVFHMKQKRRVAFVPSPKNYQIQEGSLLYEDDTVASPVKELSAHHRGYYLANYEEAQAWVTQGNTVSHDELAVIVFGEPKWETQLPSTSTTLPCWDDQQRPVLVAVTIYQLGEAKIKIKEWADQKVTMHDTSLIALTVWKEDWEDEWKDMTANPFMVLRRTLNLGEALISMWGKSFRHGKQAATPHTSSSIQVHCTVKADAVPKLLRESGHNAVWATPKTAQGKPSDAWKMIWLPSNTSFQEAKTQAAMLSQACGLAKSGNKLAIRVAKTDFNTCWKHIYPNQSPPEDIATDYLYKLENLPLGTTALAISQWASNVNWRIKPIRALGPKGWLVGTPNKPKQEQMAFNGNLLLIREVKPRQEQQRGPILAGPKPTQRADRPQTLPPLLHDPWASALKQASPTPPPAAASSAGPNDQRFQAQEERMKKIEEELATCRTSQEATQQSVQNLQQEVQQKDKIMASHVDQRLKELREEIDTGFTRGLAQQATKFESTMQTTMQELKQLIIQQASKRKSPETGDEAM